MELHPTGLWHNHRMTRREFLRHFGIAAGALSLSPFFLERLGSALAQTPTVKVVLVKNGDPLQNISRLFELIGGAGSVVGPHDVVVLKCNGQWPDRGYTHTGCLKGVVDEILSIPDFDGEIHICDNVQTYGSSGQFGFDAGPGHRADNWPDHNWNTLAAEYQSAGKPVATKRWFNTMTDIRGPADGVDGWNRTFFDFHGIPTFLSCPVYESPLTAGRMIDLRRGVWEDGAYSATRRLKVIYLPTLNYHSDYAGVTSAVKCFFGATEIHGGVSGQFRGHYQIHSSSYQHDGVTANTNAYRAGGLTARYMLTQNAPDLFVTCAMYSGHNGRWSTAAKTDAVLACSNPASLDYIACKNILNPLRGDGALNPDIDQPVRRQLLGCVEGGVGTIDPAQIELITFDFLHPEAVNRIDLERVVRKHRQGRASERDVKDVFQAYMES
ncbi:MAG: DUF362 domain-containing protein [Lentisphaerae bacterium]|nr:DUF362 domain-containing protein [Lentisphaerota bacterium]